MTSAGLLNPASSGNTGTDCVHNTLQKGLGHCQGYQVQDKETRVQDKDTLMCENVEEFEHRQMKYTLK